MENKRINSKKIAVFTQQTLAKSCCLLLSETVVSEGSFSTQHMHVWHCSTATRWYCPSTAVWQSLKMPKEIEGKSNHKRHGRGMKE
jgi:hypothetical protein